MQEIKNSLISHVDGNLNDIGPTIIFKFLFLEILITISLSRLTA